MNPVLIKQILKPELRWPRLWLGVWLFGCLLCVVLSLISPPKMAVPANFDKLEHLLAYAALAAWAALIFRRGKPLALAAFALIVLGISMEFAQAALTTTRQADWQDALANSVGVGLGVSFSLLIAPNALLRIEQFLVADNDGL